MDNKESAHVFVEAIRELASKPENLSNLESYLAQHFDKWLVWIGNEPENLVTEMKSFAEMEI